VRSRIVGAFFFFHQLQHMTLEDRGAGFETLASVGVNTILTESDTYIPEILAEVRNAGMDFWGGISCFLSPNSTGDVLEREPLLTPILATGTRRPTIEWYNGVPPTARSHRDARRAHLVEQVRQHRFDGFLLDFIRWPMHWEIEYRPGHPPPLDNSFDEVTLLAFRDSGTPLPDDLIGRPADAAAWIVLNHPREWIDFKCGVITSYVAEIKRSLSDAAGREVPLGICGVPIHPEWVGQRITDLAEVVDLICPMSYHAVLYRPAGWVKDNVAAFIEQAPGQVAPIIQIETNGAEQGADFGPAVSDKDFGRVLSDVLGLDVRGVVVFTGTELLKPARLEALREALGRSGSSRSTPDEARRA
jgi:hypothetical protein